MGHPVYDPTIEARKYSSSKFNGRSFEIFSRNYIQTVFQLFPPENRACKNQRARNTVREKIERKFRFTARTSKREEDERGRKANIERQYELPGIKLLHVLRFRIAAHLFAFLRRVYTLYERARWRKRGVRHGPITRIVPRTVNRGTHRRDDDVSREKHCERNGSPPIAPSFFPFLLSPSFYLLHSSSKS